MDRCFLCGATTERRLVTAENWWGDALTLVENVPAWVCTDCGEQYYDAATSQALDRLHVQHGDPERVVSVPVYTFAA